MQNKTTRYLKYAVGEIFLVVIGILIAIGINSRYNQAQNETKIKAILSQVQQDLVTDIIDAKRIFNVNIQKDSLFRKIMNDSITFEMYKKDPYPLKINRNYVSFSNKKGGYERFMANLEILPEKYNCLLPDLTKLYVEMQNDIDDYNTFIKNTVMEDGREALKTNPKLADYGWGRYPDEAMEYHFNNPFLRNTTMIYMNDLKNISEAANDYRIESIRVYKKIDSLLGNRAEQYDEPLTILPPIKEFDSFLGDYKESNSDYLNTVKIEDGLLMIKGQEQPDKIVYWNEGEFFFIEGADDIIRFYKNKKGQHVMEIFDINNTVKLIKTSDL